MATAEEYAKWIVENQDKKGTPEFQTVAEAYKVSRSQQQPAAPAPVEPPKPDTPAWQDYAYSGMRGMITGGPLGAATALTGEGQKQFEKAAYGAGGKVTDVTAKVLPPEAAAAAGYLTNVGMQAIPTVMGGYVGKSLGAPALKETSRSLMHSALKPPVKAIKTGKAAEAITTMLDEGINVSPGGVGKMRGLISKLNAEIADEIAKSPASVDKYKVASELTKTLRKFEKQVTPGADVRAIEQAWTEFLTHPMIKGDKIPVQLAQELKQGTYQALSKKYGEVGSASTEAQKALARGLKEQIAEKVPQVAQLNARESRILNALEMAERRALVEGNRNPGGLAWLAKNPAAFAAFMADKSSAFKSIVARMLNANAGTIPTTVGAGGMATYQATQNE